MSSIKFIAGTNVAFLCLSVAACGGSGAGPNPCSPATQKLVNAIQDTLAAYPEIGETLAPGAQEVYLSDPYLNGAAEYRVLVAGKLEPSGQIGVWAGVYNAEQNVLMGIQPVNEAAVVSMPDIAPDGGEPLEILQRLASSEAVKVAVECVK